MSTLSPFFLRLLCCGLLASGLPWASRATAHGDVEGIITAISQEIARTPTIELLLLRARLHLEHGDHASALMDCARARLRAAESPADAAAVARCLGQVLLTDDQGEEALAAIDRSLILQPNDGETLELRAQALHQLGRENDALHTYAQRESCLPQPQPQFYYDRLMIQRALRRPVTEQLAGLDQGLHRLGSLVVLEEAALSCEIDAGLMEAALVRLDRLARNTVRPESWLVQRGDLLRRLGRLHDAQNAYQAAVIAINQLSPARRQTSATQNLCQRAQAHLAPPYLGVTPVNTRLTILPILAITLLAFAPIAAPAADAITRGPYLQLGTSTSMVVRWRTDVATTGVVRVGDQPAALSRSVTGTAPTTEHELVITGLKPDTRYYYAVGDSTGTLAGDASYTFVTAPTPGTPKATRIWAIGDAGTANQDQAAVRDAYYAYTKTRATDVFLMLGDNAYNTGTDQEYQKAVFNVYHELMRQTPVWPTLGNHDSAHGRETDARYPYFQMMTLPQRGEAGGLASGSEYYYSFDYGPLHFICLDSQTDRRTRDSAQVKWLEQDLAATKASWIIAYWHHPPYSRGSHNTDKDKESIEMRAHVLPILEAGGCDLVLSGHSHCYERSYLLKGHYGDSESLTPAMKVDSGTGAPATPYRKPTVDQGTVYVVAGSSGKISGGKLNHPAHVVSLNRLGSLVVDVEGDQMKAVFLREDGAVDDAFTIIKPKTGK